MLLVVLLCIPCVGGEGSILNGIYNATTILILSPVIVLMGAGSSIKGKRSVKLCNFLGEISYPLYITHYPIMYVQMQWAWTHGDAPLYAHIVVAVGSVLLAIALAYACLKLYDLPVRQWLTDHWLKAKRA